MSNLDLIIKDLNKKMKVGNIQLGVDFQEVQKIPFSSCRLNYMTYGGIPVGRIAEFYGADGSGKTTTAIDVAGNAQRMFPDKKVLFVDIEHTFDSCWATKLGLNCDDIIYLDPDSMGAEEVFNMMIELIDSGEISLCILDSIGAMVSMQANEKQIGERTYGGVSMALTEFSKKITPVLARTQTAFIGINQVRDDMNSMYGGTTTTGGRAWRHSCSTRLEFSKGNVKCLVTKPKIAGFGMNWQNCHNMIFTGLSDSYEQYYQALRRCWRFGQKEQVNVYIIISAKEGCVKENIERKQTDFLKMQSEMTELTKEITKKELKSTCRISTPYEPHITMILPQWEEFIKGE